MHKSYKSCFRVSLALLFLITAAAPAQSATKLVVPPVGSPTVSKIEPPNWWIGLPPSPMVLLTGDNLEHAEVATSYPGVKVVRNDARSDGHHIFLWLEIVPTAKAGVAPLRVATPAGSTMVQFPLRARGPANGKFGGLTPSDVIYLIMPDRFADGDTRNDEPAPQLRTFDRNKPKAWHGGDLRGIRDHLPYLRELGVTAIWLTPFWKNDWQVDDFSYHGYHVVDFYAVDEHFGALSDLQELVSAAHGQGIKVVLDYVVNHTGPHHPWIVSPPMTEWIHGTPQKHLQPIYKFGPLTDPHASRREYRNVLEGWFADKLPDLNPDEPRLAQYLLENATWWTEITGLDAFRLDTFPYSSRQFWSGWNKGILRTYPRTITIGEVWDTDPTITAFFEGGRKGFDGIDTGLSTVFDFPLYSALRDVVIRKQPVQKIIDVLQRDWLYSRPELLVTFLGNHDTKRFLSEESSSRQKLKAGLSLLLTMRGIPQLYYGDEIAMQGGEDPDNRRDFPGGFPGDSRSAFQPGQRAPEQQEIFSYAQTLIELRRNHPALGGGRQRHIGWDDNYYAFLREDSQERLLVLFNNGDAPRTLTVPLGDTPLADARQFEGLLDAQPARLQNGNLEVVVAPLSVAVYQVQ
jgi:neopullulanase